MRARLRELALAVIGTTLLVGSAAASQSPEDVQAAIRDAAARHGVSGDYLVRVARCESRFEVYAVGRRGEVGIFQLHPQGLLRDFVARGYTDHWSIWQQADYTASAFARGLASHWSCA